MPANPSATTVVANPDIFPKMYQVSNKRRASENSCPTYEEQEDLNIQLR